jgi:hypothetical protein
MATKNEEAPAGTKYEVCTLDEDGYILPGDWYLRLAGEAQKMLEGRLGFSKTMSIDPNNPNGQSSYKVHSVSMTDTAIIQAEDFDRGGEGISYHDNDISNNGGDYRPAENVDIEPFPGGYQVGWIEDGEWLEYTMNIQDAGTYDFVFTAATENDGRTINLSIDNDSIGTAAVVNTGTDSTYSSETKITDVSLPEGEHVVKLTFNNSMNFDYFEIEPKAGIDHTGGIYSISKDDGIIDVYPIPSSNVLYIEGNRIQGVQVYDLAGNLLSTRGVNINQIDLSTFSEGIYFVRITIENGNFTTRKIIIHK